MTILKEYALFAKQFERATETGDLFDQVHHPPTGKREKKLALGIQRSLRWQAIATEEDDARDRFSALWIALESLLNAVEFPGVFEKSRRAPPQHHKTTNPGLVNSRKIR